MSDTYQAWKAARASDAKNLLFYFCINRACRDRLLLPMSESSDARGPIPVSVSLTDNLTAEQMGPPRYRKKRLLVMSGLAVLVAVCISFIARLLVDFIDLITNLSFYGRFSAAPVSPAGNHLGWWVVLVPAAGGVIIGLMALYGSKAIRGHGIPEAMEQILTNQSRIKPSITYLKPVSSAISIGTGGPFGAEGPIIATGGALGSSLGQIMRISHHERKILLAAGATAGMSAIFGSPIAAIFLAIELLLFEFSPRSILPVALACITGAAGHHFLFHTGPMFPMHSTIALPSNYAILGYSILGVAMGLLSVLVTKIVYAIEDGFERLPIHWMWWPAIGGLFVGFIGYFAPRTLGVGYNNITEVLNGQLPLQVVLSLCVMKFLSWSVSLGSGTSGGTLAPLLTIGGAIGLLLGNLMIQWLPGWGISPQLAALVGMAALFAGSSRALLTSIVFALETTGQSAALLPLLAGCVGAYLVSFFLMENTIMTEKIARRGVRTPDSYEPDVLERMNVREVMETDPVAISEENSIAEVRQFQAHEGNNPNYFVIVDNEGHYKGIVSASSLNNQHHDPQAPVGSLIKRKEVFVTSNESLKAAVEKMALENVDLLPVVTTEAPRQVKGFISFNDVLKAYRIGVEEHQKKAPHYSMKQQGLRIWLKGKRMR